MNLTDKRNEVLALRGAIAHLDEQLKALRIEHGINHYEETLATMRKQEKQMRDQLGKWWAEKQQGWRQSIQEGEDNVSLPELPQGVSFASKDVVLIINPDQVPREACVPSSRLVKAGMPGTRESIQYWPVIKEPKQ